MTLLQQTVKTASKTDNTTKIGFLTDDHYLRGTLLKVKRRGHLYDATASVKRQPVMPNVA